MDEYWKQIHNHQNYEVSNLGNVRKKITGHILKPYDNGGYLRVTLGAKYTRALVHVLVADNLICRKPFPDAQVNHKNLDKKDNRVENLEWNTPEQNVNHFLDSCPSHKVTLKNKMSIIGKKYGYKNAKRCEKPVAQIDLQTGEIVNIFSSARIAAQETGASYRNISSVCRGCRKSHKGFRWEFVSNEGPTTIETRTNKCEEVE